MSLTQASRVSVESTSHQKECIKLHQHGKKLYGPENDSIITACGYSKRTTEFSRKAVGKIASSSRFPVSRRITWARDGRFAWYRLIGSFSFGFRSWGCASVILVIPGSSIFIYGVVKIILGFGRVIQKHRGVVGTLRVRVILGFWEESSRSIVGLLALSERATDTRIDHSGRIRIEFGWGEGQLQS